MANVFFHIGMHKTASTWFQRQLFPNIQGAHLIRAKNLDVIQTALANADSRIGPHGASPIIVSHEGLGGSISWDRTPGETIERLTSNLGALTKLRPGAAVIVGYREHSRWLMSAFAQRAKKNFGATWEAYLSRFSTEELCWCRNHSLIEARSPSVFPFLYEELSNSPEQLIEDLCRFIGAPLSSDLRDFLYTREGPAIRSRPGQVLSAIMRPALMRLGRSARNRFARGISWFDSAFPPRLLDLPAHLRIDLRQDWNAFVSVVSERRGRDFSCFRVAASH